MWSQVDRTPVQVDSIPKTLLSGFMIVGKGVQNHTTEMELNIASSNTGFTSTCRVVPAVWKPDYTYQKLKGNMDSIPILNLQN